MGYTIPEHLRTLLKPLSEGLTSSEIAERFRVPKRTVDFRLGCLYKIMRVPGRDAAVQEARAQGFILGYDSE